MTYAPWENRSRDLKCWAYVLGVCISLVLGVVAWHKVHAAGVIGAHMSPDSVDYQESSYHNFDIDLPHTYATWSGAQTCTGDAYLFFNFGDHIGTLTDANSNTVDADGDSSASIGWPQAWHPNGGTGLSPGILNGDIVCINRVCRPPGGEGGWYDPWHNYYQHSGPRPAETAPLYGIDTCFHYYATSTTAFSLDTPAPYTQVGANFYFGGALSTSSLTPTVEVWVHKIDDFTDTYYPTSTEETVFWVNGSTTATRWSLPFGVGNRYGYYEAKARLWDFNSGTVLNDWTATDTFQVVGHYLGGTVGQEISAYYRMFNGVFGDGITSEPCQPPDSYTDVAKAITYAGCYLFKPSYPLDEHMADMTTLINSSFPISYFVSARDLLEQAESVTTALPITVTLYDSVYNVSAALTTTSYNPIPNEIRENIYNGLGYLYAFLILGFTITGIIFIV